MKTIGIAIPARNEEQTIGMLLDSLASQNRDDFFIVVADNASDDRTKKVIRAFAARNRHIPVHIENQPVPGTALTRKCALDTAVLLGADTLINIDADCSAPEGLVNDAIHLLSENDKSVIKYNLKYPDKLRLLFAVYFKRLMKAMRVISGFQESLLGPVLFGGCFAISAANFRKTYWDDAAAPFIPEDDYLLSRRFNAMKLSFVTSRHEILTSDRRFWGNPDLWIRHERRGDYRLSARHAFTPPDEGEISDAVKKRTDKAADRIIRSIVEFMFLSSFPKTDYPLAEKRAMRGISGLGLPKTVFRRVTSRSKPGYFNTLDVLYHDRVNRILTERLTKARTL